MWLFLLTNTNWNIISPCPFLLGRTFSILQLLSRDAFHFFLTWDNKWVLTPEDLLRDNIYYKWTLFHMLTVVNRLHKNSDFSGLLFQWMKAESICTIKWKKPFDTTEVKWQDNVTRKEHKYTRWFCLTEVFGLIFKMSAKIFILSIGVLWDGSRFWFLT